MGHAHRLDELVSGEAEQSRTARLPGHRPGTAGPHRRRQPAHPTLSAMVLGLLARSAQFVKCATGRLPAAAPLCPLPLRGRTETRRLPRSRRMARRHRGLEDALFARSRLRHRHRQRRDAGRHPPALPATTPLPGLRPPRQLRLHHRASPVRFARPEASPARPPPMSTAWNQQGCLSPHVDLRRARRHACRPSNSPTCWPRSWNAARKPSPAASCRWTSPPPSPRRRALLRDPGRPLGRNPPLVQPRLTAWTVIYEADPLFQLSCLNRFVYVKGAKT